MAVAADRRGCAVCGMGVRDVLVRRPLIAAQLALVALSAGLVLVMAVLTVPFAAVALRPYGNLGPWLGHVLAGGVLAGSAWWLRSRRMGARPDGRHRR